MGTTNDPKIAAKQKRIKEWRALNRSEDMRYVLRNERGRRCIQDIINSCKLDDPITLGGAETHATIGEQRPGLRLRKLIKTIDPALLFQMEADYNALPSTGED